MRNINLSSHLYLLKLIMEQMESKHFKKWECCDATFTMYDGLIVVEVGSADSPTWDQKNNNLSKNNVRQFAFNATGKLVFHAHAFWVKADHKSDERLSSNRAWALRFTRNYTKFEDA